MTFSEAQRKIKNFYTSHKKALNDISWVCVTLQFYRKNPQKFHSAYK